MEEADQLCGRVAIMDRGRILALDTPAALKSQIDADTIVTVTAVGDRDALGRALVERVPGITQTRPVDGGVELHVKGKDRLLPAVVTGAEDAGFPVLDISVTEPTLETVFIEPHRQGAPRLMDVVDASTPPSVRLRPGHSVLAAGRSRAVGSGPP